MGVGVLHYTDNSPIVNDAEKEGHMTGTSMTLIITEVVTSEQYLNIFVKSELRLFWFHVSKEFSLCLQITYGQAVWLAVLALHAASRSISLCFMWEKFPGM
ncbi:hypothetical protein S83_047129 [Arachis hypogaea]|nr:uncharacterized protein DS421_14g463160 [Arachis hypogaea]